MVSPAGRQEVRAGWRLHHGAPAAARHLPQRAHPERAPSARLHGGPSERDQGRMQRERMRHGGLQGGPVGAMNRMPEPRILQIRCV
jgi:hypothetical protein